jgi:hypothetical protein
MKNKIHSLVWLVLFMTNTAWAQDQGTKVAGYVLDLENNTPLSGVNIYIGGGQYGTTTNSDGYFTLKVQKFPVMLFFSYVGYEVNQYPVKAANANSLKIYLKPEIQKIGEVTISADRIIKLIRGDTLNIVDYEIAVDQIIMVANPYKQVDDERLYLTTLAGDTLSSRKITGAGVLVDVPESIDYWTRVYLYKDCFNNIQLLTNDAVYQIFQKDNFLYLIYPTPVEDFQSSLMPAKAILDGHLFTQKTTRLKNDTYVISEGDTLAKLIKTVSDPYGEFRYVRPIDFIDGLLPASHYLMRKGSYERCDTAPVIQRKNDILIIDFFGNSIDFYNAEGDLLKSVPIKFHLMEYLDLLVFRHTDIDMINFSQEILYDEKENRIWAVWHEKSTGRYSLKEINPDNGEVVRVIDVPDYPFIDRMRVYGNILYFLYTEKTYPFYRSLYRMTI